MTLSHIKDSIKKKTKELAGTHIQCKFCENPNAYISLEQYRWKVVCQTCRSEYYLKEQNVQSPSEEV